MKSDYIMARKQKARKIKPVTKTLFTIFARSRKEAKSIFKTPFGKGQKSKIITLKKPQLKKGKLGKFKLVVIKMRGG